MGYSFDPREEMSSNPRAISGALRFSNQVHERSGVCDCMAECIVVEIHIDVQTVAKIPRDLLGFFRQFRICIFRRKEVGPPVKPQVHEVRRQHVSPRIPWRIGDTKRHVVLTEEREDFFREPIQSHALSFFHLSSPDFLLGWDSPPDKRNVFGLIAANPDLARGGIRLRQFGQEIIERLGGKKIHPAWAVPGGVREPLVEKHRQHIKTRLPEALATAQTGLKLFRDTLKAHQREAQVFGNFPSLFLGLSNTDGVWEHYDGTLKFVDAGGNVIADDIEVNRYREVIGKAAESHSYLKS